MGGIQGTEEALASPVLLNHKVATTFVESESEVQFMGTIGVGKEVFIGSGN